MTQSFNPHNEPSRQSDHEPLAAASFGLAGAFRGEDLVRTRNRYDPTSSDIFQVSRSKLDLFCSCERCFYLDRRLGISRPDMIPFTLNNAVDALMKREFDLHRDSQTPHPLMTAHGIDAVPYSHPELEVWRDSLRRGIAAIVPGTRLKLAGGVDDVWVNSRGELHIVDYKATATQKVISLDDPYKASYKRQVEVYQWIFQERGFPVSPTSYFVFANGDATAPRFDGALSFRMEIIPYVGDSSWVPETVERMAECLDRATVPDPSLDCDHCRYRAAANGL